MSLAAFLLFAAEGAEVVLRVGVLETFPLESTLLVDCLGVDGLDLVVGVERPTRFPTGFPTDLVGILLMGLLVGFAGAALLLPPVLDLSDAFLGPVIFLGALTLLVPYFYSIT